MRIKALLILSVIATLCLISFLILNSNRQAARSKGVPFKGESQHLPELASARVSAANGRLSPATENTSRFLSGFADLPLTFEPNAGHADSKTNFISKGPGYALQTSPDTAVISTCGAARDRSPRSHLKECSPRAIQMRFLGVSRDAAAAGEKELPGKSNYFTGSDSSHWLVNVPHFEQVHYSNIYPGIDLVYYGNRHRLEYDFVIRPDADAGMIAFTVDALGGKNSASSTRIAGNGELIMQTAAGTIRLQPPVAYQLNSGKQKFIPVHYSKQSRNQIGFALGRYDRSKQLIIDPVLSYLSFLGGSVDDFGYAMALDSTGNIYITGGTTSADFPLTSGVPQSTYGGADSNTHNEHGDVFVTKLDPTGKTLIYSTYLGGNADENAHGIAVDTSGNVYVTGETNSPDYPVTIGAFQTTYAGGGDDAFVTELNSTGSALMYSTYVGSLEGEGGFGIAIDKAGNAYVTGGAGPSFPSTGAAYHGGISDVFVVELNASGTGLVFSTLFGGSGFDNGTGIALDSSGNVDITGSTNSPDLAVTLNAAQNQLAGGADAFVAQLDKNGNLVYCTYLGGTGQDNAGQFGAIAVDSSNRIYVTGGTQSPDFPTTAGAFQTFLGGSSDVFVTKLDPASANSLIYSTYLGGSGDEGTEEFGHGIAVDSAGNAIVTSNTFSSNFPALHAAQASLSGGEDAFVSKLNARGSALIFSTYLGGGQNDYGASVVVDTVGNTYIAGQTSSTDFPVASPLQGTLNGPSDAFIAKLSADFGVSSSPASASVAAGDSATYTVTVSPSDGLYGLPVSLACAGAPSLSTCTISPLQLTPGSSPVTATVTIVTTAPGTSQSSKLRTLTGTLASFLPLLWLSTGFIKRDSWAKTRILSGALAIIVVLFLILMVGCSGAGSSPPPKPGTPSGTSTITITGTSLSMSHTTSLTLTVM